MNNKINKTKTNSLYSSKSYSSLIANQTKQRILTRIRYKNNRAAVKKKKKLTKNIKKFDILIKEKTLPKTTQSKPKILVKPKSYFHLTQNNIKKSNHISQEERFCIHSQVDTDIDGINSIVSFYECIGHPQRIEVCAIDVDQQKSIKNNVIFLLDDLKKHFKHQLSILTAENTYLLCKKLQKMLIWRIKNKNEWVLAKKETKIKSNVDKFVQKVNKLPPIQIKRSYTPRARSSVSQKPNNITLKVTNMYDEAVKSSLNLLSGNTSNNNNNNTLQHEVYNEEILQEHEEVLPEPNKVIIVENNRNDDNENKKTQEISKDLIEDKKLALVSDKVTNNEIISPIIKTEKNVPILNKITSSEKTFKKDIKIIEKIQSKSNDVAEQNILSNIASNEILIAATKNKRRISYKRYKKPQISVINEDEKNSNEKETNTEITADEVLETPVKPLEAEVKANPEIVQKPQVKTPLKVVEEVKIKESKPPQEMTKPSIIVKQDEENVKPIVETQKTPLKVIKTDETKSRTVTKKTPLKVIKTDETKKTPIKKTDKTKSPSVKVKETTTEVKLPVLEVDKINIGKKPRRRRGSLPNTFNQQQMILEATKKKLTVETQVDHTLIKTISTPTPIKPVIVINTPKNESTAKVIDKSSISPKTNKKEIKTAENSEEIKTNDDEQKLKIQLFQTPHQKKKIQKNQEVVSSLSYQTPLFTKDKDIDKSSLLTPEVINSPNNEMNQTIIKSFRYRGGTDDMNLEHEHDDDDELIDIEAKFSFLVEDKPLQLVQDLNSIVEVENKKKNRIVIEKRKSILFSPTQIQTINAFNDTSKIHTPEQSILTDDEIFISDNEDNKMQELTSSAKYGFHIDIDSVHKRQKEQEKEAAKKKYEEYHRQLLMNL